LSAPSRSIARSIAGSLRRLRIRDSGDTDGSGSTRPREKSSLTSPEKRSRGRASGGFVFAPSIFTRLRRESWMPSTGVLPSWPSSVASRLVTRLNGAIEGVNAA
jgi:hypothetical protein